MEKYTHIGVYGALIQDNRILLIKKARGPHKGKWDLPGGAIEFGEEPYEALQREFLEETGITELSGVIRTAASYTLVYPYKEDRLEELHHIGIIYDIERINDDFVLKTGGDGEDSLGARWIQLDEIRGCGEKNSELNRQTHLHSGDIEVTPFVKEVIQTTKQDLRIKRIRNEERTYHEACYERYRLFEAGSWLHKPVKTVLDTLTRFEHYKRLTALDLGCGVGRNSIPVAGTLKNRSGEVVCVDLLESALSKLESYSRQYGVSDYIRTQLSDIGDYPIAVNHFDLIIAVSALEHIASERQLIQVLDKMARGTKQNGINCIIMNTNPAEIDFITKIELEPLIELTMSTDKGMELLALAYEGWKVITEKVKPLQFNIDRNGRSILLKSDCITYVVQKA
ncbi:MAG: class SAM-dependent methyltransferase [Paenibacillus sp.]|nr:class SAM-dependent methyltransferase [Paenibacillus sp.]